MLYLEFLFNNGSSLTFQWATKLYFLKITFHFPFTSPLVHFLCTQLCLAIYCKFPQVPHTITFRNPLYYVNNEGYRKKSFFQQSQHDAILCLYNMSWFVCETCMWSFAPLVSLNMLCGFHWVYWVQSRMYSNYNMTIRKTICFLS